MPLGASLHQTSSGSPSATPHSVGKVAQYLHKEKHNPISVSQFTPARTVLWRKIQGQFVSAGLLTLPSTDIH